MKITSITLTLIMITSTTFGAVTHSYQPVMSQSVFAMKSNFSNGKMKTYHDRSVLLHTSEIDFTYTYGLTDHIALGVEIPYKQQSQITSFQNQSESHYFAEGLDLISLEALGKIRTNQHLFYLSANYRFQSSEASVNYDNDTQTINEGQDQLNLNLGYQLETTFVNYGLELNSRFNLVGTIATTEENTTTHESLTGGNSLEKRIIISINSKLYPTISLSERTSEPTKYKSEVSGTESTADPVNTMKIEGSVRIQIDKNFQVIPTLSYETLGFDREKQRILTDLNIFGISTNIVYHF